MGSRPKTIATLLAVSCGSQQGSIWDSAGDDATTGGHAETAGSAADSDGVHDGQGTALDTASSGDDDDPGVLLDVAADDTPLPVDCECGADEWSYIWVANSSDGTVSKINTETMVEEGRYITRPDRAGNPSRTSVSVDARSVAVANRHGGLIKVWARPSFCDPDRNGQPGLQTSTGAGDVLPWGQDDCVDWYVAFDHWTTQRPVAWSGRLDAAACEDEAVWTAGCGGGFQPGFADAFSDVEVALLDGSDGTVLESVVVPGLDCSGFGPYGGAVAPDGKLWLVINNGDLASIDRDTLQTQVFAKDPQLSPYGLAVDSSGMVWVSSYQPGVGAGRLDPATGQWMTASGFDGQGGIAQSLDGRIWTVYSGGLVWIDPDSVTVGGMLPIGGGGIKGVSGDVHGNLWAVNGAAHKIDTATDTLIDTYTGLIAPYTYSDMTGAGIQNVVCDPEG